MGELRIGTGDVSAWSVRPADVVANLVDGNADREISLEAESDRSATEVVGGARHVAEPSDTALAAEAGRSIGRTKDAVVERVRRSCVGLAKVGDAVEQCAPAVAVRIEGSLVGYALRTKRNLDVVGGVDVFESARVKLELRWCHDWIATVVVNRNESDLERNARALGGQWRVAGGGERRGNVCVGSLAILEKLDADCAGGSDQRALDVDIDRRA